MRSYIETIANLVESSTGSSLIDQVLAFPHAYSISRSHSRDTYLSFLAALHERKVPIEVINLSVKGPTDLEPFKKIGEGVIIVPIPKDWLVHGRDYGVMATYHDLLRMIESPKVPIIVVVSSLGERPADAQLLNRCMDISDHLNVTESADRLDEVTPAGKATKREKLNDAGYSVSKADGGYAVSSKGSAGPDLYKSSSQAWSACWAHFQYGDWPLV